MKINKICIVCKKEFEIITRDENKGKFAKRFSPPNKKICSLQCKKEYCLKKAKEQRERKKKQIVARNCRYCGEEIESTQYCVRNFCKGKSGECYKKYLSQKRRGKNNPAYRNGFAITGSRKYTGKHLRACSKYRKQFLENNNYLFCEVCGVNEMGTPKFEVHHIYFASLFPKHKELHNHKNLILVCIGCHNKFHSKKYHDEFLKLEKDRGLKKLFA